MWNSSAFNRKHFRSSLVWLLPIGFFTFIGICHNAQADGDREYALKSGFIVNFVRFTQGLHTPEATSIVICSPDSRFVHAATETLASATIDTKPVNIMQINDIESAASCHVVFISRRDNFEWLNLLAKHDTAGQFIIGETDSFLRAAGHIRFFISSGKVRFEIHPRRLEESGLKLSSKVMRLGLITQESHR